MWQKIWYKNCQFNSLLQTSKYLRILKWPQVWEPNRPLLSLASSFTSSDCCSNKSRFVMNSIHAYTTHQSKLSSIGWCNTFWHKILTLKHCTCFMSVSMSSLTVIFVLHTESIKSMHVLHSWTMWNMRDDSNRPFNQSLFPPF